ncbi:C2 domain-containing protein 3 [Ascaphus truei]|uniref:C2 domain-containing protein 3 n=1 Tax=Ascaphus truei TaxID=8439 RepID=UPI003F5A48BC
MKSRRNTSGKPGNRRKKGVTDISPSTSLPPLVDGQLRCFLRVTVSKILWTVPKPPSPVLVRLRWWGETFEGTIFRPRDTSQTEQKGVKTTTRYAVRCGPKQFSSYLTDMGALVLEIMTKPDHLPIGRVQINGIPQLSPTHPLSGFFTIVSPTSEKLGELQVSVALEPLSETYDSSSSVPNTDISLDTALSGSGALSRVELSHPALIEPLQPCKLSLASAGRRDSESSSRATTPRGRDYLYFQENSDPNKKPLRGSQDHLNKEDVYVTEAIPPKKQILSTCNTQDRHTAEQHKDGHELVFNGPATKDLLSALLDQGSKLRDAMVVSALKSDPSMDVDVDSVLPPALNKYLSSSAAVRDAPDFLSQRLLQNLLNIHKSSSSRDVLLQSADCMLPELEAHSETRAIELLLGSSALSPARYWDGTGSPPESVSAGSDFYNESELNDPHYDQSLLENLFYTAPKSDTSLIDFLSDEDQIKSRREKATNNTKDQGLQLDQSQMSAAHEVGDNVSLRDSSVHRTPKRSLKGALKSDTVNLTMDRLALLGRIHVARVVVESLRIPADSTLVTPSKKSSKGKPPRPVSSVKRTFFVEFHFPVSPRNRAGEVSMASEITRLVSNKIAGGLVKFQQRFVFPVLFSGRMIEHWWNTDLTFRVFLRKGSQQKPGPVGSATLPLRDVLQSQGLSLSCDLPVRATDEEREKMDVGPLKVSVELAGDNKDLTSATEKTSEPALQAPAYASSHGVTIPGHENHSASDNEPPPQTRHLSYIPPDRHIAPRNIVAEVPRVPFSQDLQQAAEEDGLLLHVVLMVPEGKGFMPAGVEPSSACNSYLKCKLFSAQEASRSPVVWGTTQPVFNFSQVAPVSLTSRLLERLKNNVMIIEVWNKVLSPGRDQLLGLAKLPLHQFYMSFSDPKISRLLLQAQYPVVAVDSFVQVMDMFSGSERGKLKVLLALGSGDQVVALQRLKDDEGTSPAQLPRPAHFLDPPQAPLQAGRPQEGMTEHVFEIHVENVKGLTPLQSTVWGEADCYVQYYFPVHSPDPNTGKGAELPESGINLKPVRSATALCVPDPVFNDRQSHFLVAQSDTPVQRLLLSAFSMQGLSGGGGVPFEVWCRYYYPNVRDQMVAKGVLPLSRLCAMVTMQHREEVGIQAFSLPLIPRSENPEERHLQSSGLLNVNVKYRRAVRSPAGMLATRMVSISVQIHQASGLQAAARVVAEDDPSLQYSADVGVNAYVTVQPSFLPEVERRSTRTVARTFSPEFDHQSEFPCHLVIQRSSGETCCLAELLSFSEIVLSIHHQSVESACASRAQPARDYLLGVVRIPTRELLTKRSGITGWYPVTVPEDATISSTASIMQTIVGGLEISIGFAHHSDRERVLEVARGLGWNEKGEEDVHEVRVHDVDEWQRKEDLVTLSVALPKVWLPMHCLLLAGQKRLHKSTYCYLRYKLYDNEAVCSPLKRPKLSEDEQQATVTYEQTKTTELLKHQPLVWYLREERLEIQIWRAYGKDTSGPRPQDSDRLLGCAYVDLTALAENTSRTLTVSEDPCSVTGSPLTERAVSTPSCCVSFAVAGSTSPVTTPVIENTDEPTWNFQHQVRLTKELLLDPQQTLVFKVWHKHDVERVLGFASVDLSPLLSGFQSVCGWYNIGDFAGQCQGQVKVSITPLESIVHLKEERRVRSESAAAHPEVTSQRSFLYQPNPAFCGSNYSISRSHELTGVSSKPNSDFQASERGDVSGLPFLRHEEHMENVRRFHESLQQVERNPHSTEHLDALTQSSRPSLLPALRKNMSELDEIQKYFNQKLYRSLSSPGPGGPSMQNQGSEVETSNSIPTAEESDTQLLLKKSNLLVSQVSSLITDLQGVHKITRAPSSILDGNSGIQHLDVKRQSSMQYQQGEVGRPVDHEGLFTNERERDHVDTQPFSSVDSSTYRGGMLDEFVEQGEEESHLLVHDHHEEMDEHSVQSCSDEDYEEDVIEPRTLNEITTMTDRTSPWSSILSDTEPDFVKQPKNGRPQEQPVEALASEDHSVETGLFSAFHQDDQSSIPSTARSGDSQATEGDAEFVVRKISSGLNDDIESIEIFQGSQSSGRHRAEEGVLEGAETDVMDRMRDEDSEESCLEFRTGANGTSWGSGDAGQSQVLHMNKIRETNPLVARQSNDLQSGYPYVHSESSQQSTSPSDKSCVELPDGPGNTTIKSMDLLPEPLLFPNFFLPPQDLEASMRMMSLSPALPVATAQKTGSDTQITMGIPFRRHTRHRPKLTAADLPKEETNRIARIFAAQFSKTK